MKPKAEDGASNAMTGMAIARVLDAEREARDAVERARQEVDRIAEDARKGSRALAERTERRVRAVVEAFERELAASLAAIDAESAVLVAAEPLTATEQAALQRAVAALARELVGAAP